MRKFGYGLFLILFAGFLDYCAYRFYLHGCRKPGTITQGDYFLIPGADPLLSKRLGLFGMDPAKQSSFLRFPKRKKPGILRIGCLGDSFTYGAEVDEHNDFPTLLQELFDRRGKGRVEVLNFGFGGQGFPQAFLVWKTLARQYDLDRILLGPGAFYDARANTFSHAQELLPFYIHSRFILDRGKTRLIDVPGTDLEETFDRYNSFIPSWDVLRYDARPPAFIKALLPAGRTMKNPFYYHRGALAEEAERIYAGLLGEMADDGKPIILVHPEERIRRCAADLRRPNLRSFPDPVPVGRPFPYRMPAYHNSPTANRLLAEYFLAILTGKTDGGSDVIETRNIALKDLPAGPSAGPRKALKDFASVEITDGRAVVGGLYSHLGSRKITRIGSWDFPAEALLGIAVERKNLFDSAFLALDFPLTDGMELTLHRPTGVGSLLGKVRTLVPGMFGLVEVPHSNFYWEDASLGRSAPALYLSFTGFGLPLGSSGEKVELRLDGRRILSGRLSNDAMISLIPDLKPGPGCTLVRLAPSPSGRMAPARAEGGFFIRFAKGAEQIAVPVARWSRQRVRWRF